LNGKRPLLQLCLLFLLVVGALAQAPARKSTKEDADLQFVIYLSRHGVRSPTGKAPQYNIYSSASWPIWDVPPGYLTAHGAQLMELFGAWDRAELAAKGLLHERGCEDAAHVTVYADSDQRTQETGKALAKGLLPGCDIHVQFLPEGTNDPLFHSLPDPADVAARQVAVAALAGRIGGDPANLVTVNHDGLAELDHILASCGTPVNTKRTSLFDIPSTISAGSGDHLAEYKGPLSVASTLSENLLLEYTEGKQDVGWGCVDGARLRSLINLHTSAVEVTQRTPAIARAQASNLLDHITRALEQSVTQKSIAGAIARPSDHVLFLVGHDTNLENIAGLLHLDWIADGRRDDTPPGSALVFELWKERKTGSFSVKTYFTAQTLEQMRAATPLSPANPPSRVSVFLPGCSRQDGSCTWSAFQSTLNDARTR
jgi:4-phytase/acid phosphatase